MKSNVFLTYFSFHNDILPWPLLCFLISNLQMQTFRKKKSTKRKNYEKYNKINKFENKEIIKF